MNIYIFITTEYTDNIFNQIGVSFRFFWRIVGIRERQRECERGWGGATCEIEEKSKMVQKLR